jgi:hypothetical protein
MGNTEEIKTVNLEDAVKQLCVAMCLLNPSFLDPILDEGKTKRYRENASMLVEDLKNILSKNNRLRVGAFNPQDVAVEAENKSVVLVDLSNVKFSLKENYGDLVEARNIARAIADKLNPSEKLNPDMIKFIYWVSPFKNSENKEDVVIELLDSTQFGICIDTKLSNRSTSFQKMCETFLNIDQIDIYSGKFTPKWDAICKKWVELIYGACTAEGKNIIHDFIKEEEFNTISYFSFFRIGQKDDKYAKLGKRYEVFDENIPFLYQALTKIYENGEVFFLNDDEVYSQWNEIKRTDIYSHILEHYLTTKLIDKHKDSIDKVETGVKEAKDNLKVNIFNLLVQRMGVGKRNMFYVAKSGAVFNMVPNRQFFVDNYDDFKVYFDYHVFLNDSNLNDPFEFNIWFRFKEFNLITVVMSTDFSKGCLMPKLNTKIEFEMSDNFTSVVTDEILSRDE